MLHDKLRGRITSDGDGGVLLVIDESGEDYLHPSDYFILVDLPHDVVATLDISFSRGAQQSA